MKNYVKCIKLVNVIEDAKIGEKKKIFVLSLFRFNPNP